MKPDRLIVFRGVDGDWRWQRRNGANGRIVTVQTEGKPDLIVTRGGAG